jgi:DNA-binding CsgD family transcriptional regulator
MQAHFHATERGVFDSFRRSEGVAMFNDELIPEVDIAKGGPEACLKRIARQFSLKNVTYLSVEDGPDHDTKIRFASTYSKEWVDRYLARDYQHIDPVIKLTRKKLLPLDWATTDQSTKEVRDFFGESRECGVGKQGLSIPIRGPNREAALFTVTSDIPDVDWDNFKKDVISYLQVVGYEYHKAMIEAEFGAGNAPPVKLSPRERDMLAWAASGKTTWETSIILGISEATANFYMAGAISKLSCVNKTHAVAKALRSGLI